MSVIGTGSLLGIALLVLLVFASPRLVAVLQMPVLVGALAGLSVCLLVFGRVHALTVVFGASLLGVAVDYPLHFACHVSTGSTTAARIRVLRTLMPGLAIALATTLAAYLALAVPPFPGLRQMALFAGVGLCAAWLTVVCWGPWLVTRGLRWDAPAVRVLRDVHSRLANCPLKLRLALLAVAVVAAAPGIARLSINDDLRALQNSPPLLLAEQVRVAAITGLPAPAQYFLVRGADAGEVLEREEHLAGVLDGLRERGMIGGHLALSQWVPSPARQARDHALLDQRIYGTGGALEPFARAAGFDEAWIEGQRADFAAAGREPLTLAEWLAAPVSDGLRGQWLGCAQDGCASIVLLQDIAGIAGLRALAALAAPSAGISWVDSVASTTELLARYRAGMTDMLGWAVAATLVLLWLRLRSGALRALAPPLLAGFLTLAAFGWAGLEVNLFVVLALALLLGMGVDYGIYLAEPLGQQRAGIGIALAAMTTLLGFGLLALSSTPALHLFGLTLACGVSLAWLIAHLTGTSTALFSAEHRSAE